MSPTDNAVAARPSLVRGFGRRGIVGLWLVAVIGCSEDSMAQRVVFSAVQGHVLAGGQPVRGAKVERRAEWEGNTAADHVETATDGFFALPAIVRSADFLSRLLPSEPVIEQTIDVVHGGVRRRVWFHIKGSWSMNSENVGRPIRVVCHLDGKPEHRGKVFGLCDFV